MDVTPPRRREQQAQQTREQILRAARGLFAERGYSRTSVRDIAAAAGVSAQTVYDSIGSKQAVVVRLNDLIDTEAGVADLARGAMGSDDPTVVAALPARITCTILDRCGDIVHALVTGAAAEPDLAAALADAQRRHEEGARHMAGRLRQLDALADGVTVEDAAATVAALGDVRLALVLRDDYGWSIDRVEAWIVATTAAAVLRA